MNGKCCFGHILTRRLAGPAFLEGILLAACIVLGRRISLNGTIQPAGLPLCLKILAAALPCALVTGLLWTGMEALDRSAKPVRPVMRPWLLRILRHRGLTWALLMLCWLPCYLSIFPGNFTYDATGEYLQLYQGYRADYPMLHSILVTRTVGLAEKLFFSANAGIAVLTAAQMALLAAGFADILKKFFDEGISSLLLAAAALYYAAFPAIHLLVTCMVRDVMFSGLLNYLCFQIYLMLRDPRDYMGSRVKTVFLGILITLTLLSRSNNAGTVMKAAFVLLAGAVLIFSGKAYRRGGLRIVAASLVSFAVLNAATGLLCRPLQPAHKNASLSMLTQPLCRAYLLNGPQWSEEDREAFAGYFNGTDILYLPEIADPTKGRLDLEQNSTGDFLRLCIKIGRQYPAVYADAVLLNTHAMWFPGAVPRGYNQAGVPSYAEYDNCYMSFKDEIEEPGQIRILLPGVHDFYESIALMGSYRKIPVLGLLFAIGFHVQFLFFAFFYLLYRRRKKLYVPLLLLLAYTLGSAFVPLILLRYFAALFFAFPMVLIFALQPTVSSER